MIFNCTPVFYANYQSKAKVVINQGGTSSSKTYSIVQLLFLRALEKKRVITITGESIPNLKKGAYRDAETIYSDTKALRAKVESWNKTDRIIHFKNGSLIEFVSNLDQQSAKNGKRDILFVNEANGIDWMIFWQLAIRTRGQIFVDYNPSAPFYIHEKLVGTTPETNDLGATVELIISDHRHNTFLSPEDHAKIENIKDPDLRRVYARGMTGKVRGLICGHFKKCQEHEIPQDVERIFYSMDLGYTNDPTALVKIWAKGRTRWFKKLSYTPGISATDIKSRLLGASWVSPQQIYSEADPNMINQLRLLGMPVSPAIKGPGSIIAGLSKLREYECFYVDDPDFDTEIQNYKWVMAQDMLTGKEIMTNQPVDAYNHIIDACRMGIFTDSFRHR